MTELSTTADTETPEQAAERIAMTAGSGLSAFGMTKLAFAIALTITEAVAEERERIAVMLENWHPQPCICTVCQIHAEGAAAIRQGETS